MGNERLEAEDHQRDAAFNKALHGKSSQARGGLAALSGKDAKAQKAAVDEYFKHWDNKTAGDETEEIREVSYYLSQHDALALFALMIELANNFASENRHEDLNMQP
jgi:hypothetical protein